jgi:hypothetical protein
MPVHARCGHPIKVGAHAGYEPGGAACRDPAWHVRVPAARVDQFVQLPARIRQYSRAERLLDCGTLPCGQGLGGLLPRPIGGVLRGSGGVMGA